MSHQSIRIEKEPVILNSQKGYITKIYKTEKNVLGGFRYRLDSILFKRTRDNLSGEKKYLIKEKELRYFNSVSVTFFSVFELKNDAWIFVGRCNVESRGLAHNSTCLKEWLKNKY